MSAKSSISNWKILGLAIAMMLSLSMPVMAEERDSIAADNTTEHLSKYDQRIHYYRKGWASLIPTHVKMQYAGNMGFMSFGFGWDYGRHRQWETDI
jgi:hypothetical protein